MTFLSPITGMLMLIGFAAVMILITKFAANTVHLKTKEGFLLADRGIGWFQGSLSIAASWIWAPALFVSTQFAYEKGLAGIFWFTAPNILALVLFAFFAPKIREKFGEGFTLPQFIKNKFKSERLHKLYLFPYVFYQVMAITVQLYAGGSFVSLLTGIPLLVVMPILLAISLTYTWIAGLKASVITDMIQMIMIFGIGTLIVSMVVGAVDGWSVVQGGLKGVENIQNMLDPGVAFSFGIVTSIGLIAGAISDQQYWQRSFAIKKKDLVKSFILGGVFFGLAPLGLSILGLVAANPATGIVLSQGTDVSMIGVQTVATLLPTWAVLLFFFMLLSGLSSTLDSGLSAFSSLWMTDIQPKSSVLRARLAMLGVGLLGLLIAVAVIFIPGFGLMHLWWVFNTIAACVAVPTILSLYKKHISESGVFWGILVAFVLGIPLFVYSNLINNPAWIVCSSLFVVLVSTGFSLLGKQTN